MSSLTDFDDRRSAHPMERHGVDTTSSGLFPFTALKVLGSLQISLGVLSALAGAADLSFLLINYQNEAKKYGAPAQDTATFDTLRSLTLASAPVWCGSWFVVTGLMGTYVSRKRPHRLRFLKKAFLVLSVLCAIIFAPACAVVSGFIAVMRHTLDHANLIWLASTTAAFLSVCEMMIAFVSASVCCCCASVRLNKVHVLYPEPEDHVMSAPPWHSFARDPRDPRDPRDFRDSRDPSVVRAAGISVPTLTRTVREIEVQTEPPSQVAPKPADQGPPPLSDFQRYKRQRFLPRPLSPEDSLYSDYSRFDSPAPSTMSYRRLKNWALP